MACDRCTLIVYPLPEYVAAEAIGAATRLMAATEIVFHPEMLTRERRHAVADACVGIAVHLKTAAEALRQPPNQSRREWRCDGACGKEPGGCSTDTGRR